MATNFPNSLDSLTNPVSTDQLNSPSHSDQHINANDAIEALQAKVGTDNSAVTTSHDYRIRQLELNPVTSTANKIEQVVVNGASETTLLKGQVVYASGSVGASGKLRVTLSSNSAESTSSKTFGILAENIIPGGEGLLVSEGLLEGIDTTGANDGDPIWLGSTPGSLIFGLINKPVAPSHLVFLGIVVRGGQQNTGSIFVKIQNGFEIEELHNILITDVQDKDALIYDDSTGLWKNYDLTQDFVSSSDVQNSLGDYIPLTALGQPSGPAELNPDGDLLIPQDKIIFEGATADDHELTLQSPDVTSDIIVTLPNSTGTIALTSEIPSLTGYATETYVNTAVSDLVSSAPETLDTLNELAAALGDDPNYATTITTALGDKVSKSGGDTITSSLPSVIGLTIKGAASQTADLQQWQSSSGSVVSLVNSNGFFSLGASTSPGGILGITAILPISRPFVIKAHASQTANLTEWQNSAGTVIANITPNGGLHVSSNITQSSAGRTFIGGTGDHSAFLNVSIPTASRPGIVIRANNASQTANLQEWQNSSGAVVASIDSLGKITSHNRDTAGGNNNLTISGYYNGSTSSLDLQSNGITRASLISSGTIGTDSSFRIHTRINDVLSERFRIATTGRVGFNTNNPSSGLHFLNTIASDVGIIVQGATSQTANLQEWQDNSGTVLTIVNPSGNLFVRSSLGNFAAGTNLGVKASSSTSIPLSVAAASGQAVDLTRWYASDGTTVLAKITATGDTTFGYTYISGVRDINGTGAYINMQSADGVLLNTRSASNRGLVIKGSSSQTATLLEFVDSNNNSLGAFNSNGLLYVGSINNRVSFNNSRIQLNNNGLLVDTGVASNVPLTVQSTNASQTADIQQWKNSTGTVLAKVDALGAMFTTTAAVGTDTDQVATTAFVIDQIDASTQPGSLYQADAPTSPEVGQIWIESDSYSDSFDPNIIRRQSFTATLGQTIFTTAVSFIEGYEQVYFNGLLLLRTTDYTTSGGNTVTLIEAAAADDIIEVVTITNLNSVNTYTQAEIDAKIALEVNNLVASAPSTLNTLDELAAALNDDANFASTVTTSLAGKKNETSSSISSNANLVAGTRYFVTSASALTLTLPSTPSVNDQIDIFDASGNASTYNITVARNGNLINGNAGNLIIDVNGGWFTLVFTGNTYGWKVA